MARTIAERVKDVRWWCEAAAHYGLGAVAAGVVAVGSPILGGVLAALWLALVREFDQRPVESWPDAVIDVAAGILGGLTVGLVIWAVA